MKKFTFLALSAMMLAPATSFAESWERTVTNVDEFNEAWNLLGAGADGETYTIICDWAADEVVTPGTKRPTITKGKLIIKSNQTDFDLMPQVNFSMEWNSNSDTDADMPAAELGHRVSFFFENLRINANNRSYFMDNRIDFFVDTISFTNCDITGAKRSFLRIDGDRTSDAVEGGATGLNINTVQLQGCRVHGNGQSSGDNWSVFRLFPPVDNISITDCMFYDMPYTKSIVEKRYPTNGQCSLNFSNNMVLMAENGNFSSTGFTVLMTDTTMTAGTMYYVYNNIFVGPKAGQHIPYTEEAPYPGGTKISNCRDNFIIADNNVFDFESYMTVDELQTWFTEHEKNSTIMTMAMPNRSLADYTDFSWEVGATFQDPTNDLYFIRTSHPWYTQGYFDGERGASYIGPSCAYVESFPTPASINITIDGPSYIGYTIAPERAVYYIGDEITITLDPQTNNYLTNLNTFNGWADGVTELSRSEVLTGDLNLTASFTGNDNVVSAFTLNQITSNGSPASYDADVYLNMDPAYQAQVLAITVDTTSATGSQASPFHYHNGTFQSRPGKFGEDALDAQMPILSRRTPKIAKNELRDYALFTINTTNLSDVHFSCYVGTDNNACGKQLLQYSADSTNWVTIGEVTIENCVWGLLEGDLPAEANNQAKVYVRAIGDVTSTPVVTPDEGIGMWDGAEIVWDVYNESDAFEYIGSILITANTSGASNGIAEVVTEEQKLDPNAPMYNVMGMRVAKGTKGLILQNGRKFIVK